MCDFARNGKMHYYFGYTRMCSQSEGLHRDDRDSIRIVRDETFARDIVKSLDCVEHHFILRKHTVQRVLCRTYHTERTHIRERSRV